MIWRIKTWKCACSGSCLSSQHPSRRCVGGTAHHALPIITFASLLALFPSLPHLLGRFPWASSILSLPSGCSAFTQLSLAQCFCFQEVNARCFSKKKNERCETVWKVFSWCLGNVRLWLFSCQSPAEPLGTEHPGSHGKEPTAPQEGGERPGSLPGLCYPPSLPPGHSSNSVPCSILPPI